EARLRCYGRASGARVTLLRIPGIYALDRDGGDPRERVARGAPVLAAEDDVYTNHIHADDLARACLAALHRGRPQRAVHVCDDSERTMGEHYALVAALAGLPPPPRLSRTEAAERLSPVALSFWSESRRLSNRRLKRELRVALRFPDVRDALVAG
ncbi:MAG TPA: SDR family NAD(P)-dependent oxidoreductase, partial [Methylibium sp.]|nr:SDR family NAD(P)-dependent oxidoreductase [Methylibium sp.]